MSQAFRVAVLSIILVYVSVHNASAHSWVACTDYRMTTAQDRETYDQTKCRAYPRNWSSGSVFGSDIGFDFQGSEAKTCRDPIGSAPGYGYTTQYPMAQYAPGQTVCLAWPTKNHVAAQCTNPYIPDQGLKIFASAPNPTADPTQTQFKQFVVEGALNGVHENGVIDFKGFQNCPRFCENMDKSLCTGCFTVPNSVQVGAVYTFQWYWIFNQGAAPYTTCWEALISGSSNTGPITTGPASSGPITTGPASSGPITTGPASSGPITTGPASSGPITTGPASSGPVTTGPLVTTSSSGTLPDEPDIVIFAEIPNVIPYDGAFVVQISYSVPMSRDIVVEVVDQFGNGYARGVSTVSQRGTVAIRVTIFNPPSIGSQLILRALIVPQGKGNNPIGYELDVQETNIVVGDTIAATNTTMAVSSSSFSKPVGILTGLLALCGIFV